jgi:phage gpG-like protein
MATPVQVEGMAKFRRSVKAIDRGALAEVQAVTRYAAEIVASKARTNAPVKTGKLRDSIVGTTSGASGIVRSPLPYAAVHEYGGTIRPRGVPIVIARSAYVDRAADDSQERVMQALATGFDKLCRLHGWR